MKILSSAFLCLFLLNSLSVSAKEVALTFDDAPNSSTLHFTSKARTEELIRKLKTLEIPSVMVFANACKGSSTNESIKQLKRYKEAGHIIGNHTCSHPRLDEVGFEKFVDDVELGDLFLSPLFKGQKFFRYPYLNEGKDLIVRNQMRDWLRLHNYRNAVITGDNEDPTFSAKINEAKKLGKKINYDEVQRIFLKHIISSLECNDALAIENLGRSPKHVLLLHEADATVMFIDSLVTELKTRNWKIISPIEAYSDPLYLSELSNTYSGAGIIAQLEFEKTGNKKLCYDYPAIVKELNKVLDL
jgi:peptidoglycan/xylan/chitin deacetylase (PgdA/CDA1 family)